MAVTLAHVTGGARFLSLAPAGPLFLLLWSFFSSKDLVFEGLLDDFPQASPYLPEKGRQHKQSHTHWGVAPVSPPTIKGHSAVSLKSVLSKQQTL